jgi:hypothetical protein
MKTTEMNGPALLEWCGTDAARWAQAFAEHSPAGPDEKWDEGFLIGWFANAMCLADEERRAKEEKTTIETLGLLSAVLADHSGAWDGLAPNWFPQPPEWLQLWQECEDVITCDPDAPDKPTITYKVAPGPGHAQAFLDRLEAIDG